MSANNPSPAERAQVVHYSQQAGVIDLVESARLARKAMQSVQALVAAHSSPAVAEDFRYALSRLRIVS